MCVRGSLCGAVACRGASAVREVGAILERRAIRTGEVRQRR